MVAILATMGMGGCKALSRKEDPRGRDANANGSASLRTPATSGWTLEDLGEGRIRVAYDRAPILELGYAFWGKDWQWAEPKITATADGFRVDVESLALAITGAIETDAESMTIAYELKAERALAEVVGGGLELVAPIDLDRVGVSAPTVTDDRSGFAMRGPGGELTVRFDRPPPKLYVDPQHAGRVRVHLVSDAIAAGTSRYRMTIALPKGGVVLPPLAARYGPTDPQGWPATLWWDRTPLDLRASLPTTDRPAGVRGPVRLEGERLVFADGTPARFWGTNVVGYALFGEDKAAITAQAQRLAAFGFNLVRIHHHDSGWVDPNVFDRESGTTTKLRDASLDRLDWWIKALQDEGIYVWIDLHVGRVFTPSDKIAGYDELARQGGEGKGFSYLNRDVEALMQRFARQYLDRENRYTKRRWIDDPGVLAVLVTNENDLAFHFGSLFVASAGNDQHRALFDREVAEFAKTTSLDAEALRQPWLPGPSKFLLADLEARFFRRAIDDLRKTGYKGAIATTSYWSGGLYCLPSLTVGDLIDVHVYGEAELLSSNPRHVPHFLHWAATAQVAGMPLSITEWNIPAPARDRFVGPLMVAAMGSLQGWDAPMQYAYVQLPLERPEQPSQWSALDDPAVMAMMPTAALAFRRGDIALAQRTYRIDLDPETLYGRETSAATSAAMRTLAEQSRIVLGLPDAPSLSWDRVRTEADATAVKDLDRSFLDPEAEAIVSDTGEITRDWAKGTLTIDTPRTQAAMGWIGGDAMSLADLQVHVTTAKAAVAVTSLDGAPIAASRKLLLTVVARAVPGPGDRLPWRAEPVTGALRLRSRHDALTITPQPGSPAAAKTVLRTKASDGWHAITLPADAATHWWIVEPAHQR